MIQFFESVLDSIIRTYNFGVVKCIIIASAGFLKDDFHSFMMSEMVKKDLKVIVDNHQKFLKCSSHSGQKRALREILSNPEISKKLGLEVQSFGSSILSFLRLYSSLCVAQHQVAKMWTSVFLSAHARCLFVNKRVPSAEENC